MAVSKTFLVFEVVFLFPNNVTFPLLRLCSAKSHLFQNFKIILQVLLSGKDAPPAGCAFENVNENLKLYLKAEGKVDVKAELEKMRNKRDDAQK